MEARVCFETHKLETPVSIRFAQVFGGFYRPKFEVIFLIIFSVL